MYECWLPFSSSHRDTRAGEPRPFCSHVHCETRAEVSFAPMPAETPCLPASLSRFLPLRSPQT